jgi:hypothetical protein
MVKSVILIGEDNLMPQETLKRIPRKLTHVSTAN